MSLELPRAVHGVSATAVAVASLLTALIAGLGVATQPALTFGLVLFVLLAGLYLRFPVLVPLVFVSCEMVLSPVGQIGSFNLFLSDLVWLPGIILVFSSRRKVPTRHAMERIHKQASLILFFGLVSTILAADMSRSIVGMVQLIELLSITYITVLSVRRTRDIKLVLLGLFLAIGLNALVAVGQLAHKVPIPEINMDAAGGVGRVTGLSGNALGVYLVLGLALAGSFLLAPPWPRKILTAIGGSVMLISLVATGIRSAWLSLVVVGLVSGFIAFRNVRGFGHNRMAVAGLLALSVPILASSAALLLPGGSFYAARLLTLTSFDQGIVGSTTYARLQFWKTSVEMIRSHPLFGVGLKNWVVVKYQYGLPEQIVGLSTQGIPDPHHVFLEIGAERGLLGLLVYLMLYVTAIHIAWSGLRGTWPKSLAFPLLVIVVSRPLAEVFGGDVGTEKLWFIVLGLILAMRRLQFNEQGAWNLVSSYSPVSRVAKRRKEQATTISEGASES